ncbi:amidohydrolase family protein [Paenibacillus cymbidii]|uniref:amidohydrolase family protein n=1 Tax=Paenibacillus cymbidii TaxID=1639034 RepID=UPI0010819C71|nr:hypothetical protein [Paenibacillus cymbidii]
MSGRGWVIHAGRLIEGTGNAPLEPASVWVRDGRIVYAGRRDQLPVVPETATVVDAPELTVLPGLVDGHNGVSGDLRQVKVLRCYLQYGVTTVVSYSGNQQGELPAAPLRDAIEGGLLRGCAQLHVGYMVNCTNGHNRGRTADGPWEWAATGRARAIRGSTAKRAYSSWASSCCAA